MNKPGSLLLLSMAADISGIIHHSFYASKFIGTVVRAIIPEIKDAENLSTVLKDIPTDIVKEVIVVLDPAVDKPGKLISAEDVTVLQAKEKGYGNVCRVAQEYLDEPGKQTDIVVFLSGDQPFDSGGLINVLLPVADDSSDFVIGSALLTKKEAIHQPFGNRLAFAVIQWLYGIKFTGTGLIRAIRYDKLKRLNLKGKGDDWLVEMQVKAAKFKLKCREVPAGGARSVKTKEMSSLKLLRTVITNI